MTAPHTAAPDPRRRTKVLVCVGLGVVLVALVASRFLGGGGDAEVAAVVTPPAATAESAAVPATPAAEVAPAAAEPAVETFEVFTTKNPFAALRTATPIAATGPAPAAAAAAPAGTAAPVSAAAPAAAATATGGQAAGGQATEPGRTTRVALLDVFAEGDRVVANVRVNDTVSKVGAGDTFASNFKVVSLDQAERCGRFLYGDDQFRMCRGEELLK